MAAKTQANPYARTHSSGELIRRFWPYERKYIKIVLLDLFCASLTCLCDLVLPQILRTITNAATYTVASLTTALVLKMAALYLVLRLVDAAAQFFMAFVDEDPGEPCLKVLGLAELFQVPQGLIHRLIHGFQRISFTSEVQIGRPVQPCADVLHPPGKFISFHQRPSFLC